MAVVAPPKVEPAASKVQEPEEYEDEVMEEVEVAVDMSPDSSMSVGEEPARMYAPTASYPVSWPMIDVSSTVLIFDWDDTLLANTWLTANDCRLDAPAVLPQHIVDELQVVERMVVTLLERATQMGTVVIITNAEAGWVQMSAERFMPGVVPLLTKTRIVSARTTYEAAFPYAPAEWKAQAFAREIQMALSRCPDKFARNVISFGDSIHERDAVHRASRVVPQALIKSIKFVERPSIEQLRHQVYLVSNCLQYICSHPNHMDLMLTIQMLANNAGVAK